MGSESVEIVPGKDSKSGSLVTTEIFFEAHQIHAS